MNEHDELNVMDQIHTTAHGCNITLNFPKESKPDIRRDLARVFLAAVEEQAEYANK